LTKFNLKTETSSKEIKVQEEANYIFGSKNLDIFFLAVGGLADFSIKFFKNVFIPPYEFSEIKKHVENLGIKTMPIVTVTGFIIGLVLAIQSQPVMARFGAEAFLPSMVALSVFRELGPVITALIFAGRVSSGIGAELGSMRVTEQIDAMEVSAIHPFRFLVVTRILSCIIVLPLLTLYVDFLAIIGGYIAIALSTGMGFQLYLNSVFTSVVFGDFLPGFLKTFIFGYVVGLVGTYKGYNASNGTVGVGEASTTSVVVSSLIILIFDMVLAKITIWLWPTV
jgi:phospholipid/cholesterol/gamma-HCH transport system permease protein